jgi:hypothetical protein
MKQQVLKTIATSAAAIAITLGAFPGTAQTIMAGKGRVARKHSSPLTRGAGHIPPPGASPYTFTYFGFPRAPFTGAYSINSGASTPRIDMVGAYGSPSQDGYGNGFLLQVGESKGTITEAFSTLNIPGETLQEADGINDSGQIVGNYIDSSNNAEGYLLSGGIFTPIQATSLGATSTLPEGINNDGDIVGLYEVNGNGIAQGFELSGGVYTSLSYPGAPETQAVSINNKGDIVGFYFDTAEAYHGFLLSGGTYTSIDVPGAVGTFAYGINDSGNIVGVYCTTSGCLTNNDGAQGFLLSAGTFTTINVPSATATILNNINDKGVLVGQYYDCDGLGLGLIATP